MNNELLKKIKALVERGYGGEKENAEKLLKKFMQEHNIKEEDLDEDTLKFFPFKSPKFFNSTKLVQQVLYSVVGGVNAEKGVYVNDLKQTFIKCTSAEFLEFEAKFKFYSYHFKNELETFYRAFIEANNIYPPPDKTLKNDNYELTDKERAALKMASSLDKHDYLLQIEEKKK